MQQWEYIVEPYDLTHYSEQIMDEADRFGLGGYEMCGVLPGQDGQGFRLMFKRPKPTTPDEVTTQ